MDVSEFYEPEHFGVRRTARQARHEEMWRTADGVEMRVVDMEDSHLFNATMKTGSKPLFREMVYRLFERGMVS